MGAEHLSNRENWQREARITGKRGENQFVESLAPCLPGHYEIIAKPRKIPVYSNGKGIVMDSQIINHQTGKTLFIEKKTGTQGGNTTEERACKFLSRGLKRKVKECCNTVDEPFFMVFSGRTFFGESFRSNTDQLVNPRVYQEKLSLLFEGENYAIMEPGFTNIQKVADQIMEIV